MDLWIRTQDRTTLIRSSEIYIIEQLNRYVIRAKRTSHILGSYDTYERALEVLDEIQKLLEPKIIIKNEGRDCVALDGTIYRTNLVSNVNSDIQQLSTYVYQMPED